MNMAQFASYLIPKKNPKQFMLFSSVSIKVQTISPYASAIVDPPP